MQSILIFEGHEIVLNLVHFLQEFNSFIKFNLVVLATNFDCLLASDDVTPLLQDCSLITSQNIKHTQKTLADYTKGRVWVIHVAFHLLLTNSILQSYARYQVSLLELNFVKKVVLLVIELHHLLDELLELILVELTADF